MGCRSDYMEPTARENESILVCGLIKYLFGEINKPIPSHVEEAAKAVYGKVETLDADTALLCDTLQNLPKKVAQTVVYDGSKKNARRLADWWEAHQEADRKREAAKKELAKRKKLAAAAKKKLSPAERNALGIT